MQYAHYQKVKEVLGKASLVVVTKHHSAPEILEYYNAGERAFGENRVSELKEKYSVLPSDIRWQFIGHLQKNKVRPVVKMASCIQSLDSLELAMEINRECQKISKVMSCLVEVHLAAEDTNKTGIPKEELLPLLKQCETMENISIDGLMVMGPHTEDKQRIQEVFSQAHTLFCEAQKNYPSLQVLSMGMSDDYEIALTCGSNMVRIGSYLFETGD